MIDYILTAAVGISAGVGALVSAAPSLQTHTLGICLAILLVLTLVNLWGVQETGGVFMLPTYLFIACLLGMIGIGPGRHCLSLSDIRSSGNGAGATRISERPVATHCGHHWQTRLLLDQYRLHPDRPVLICEHGIRRLSPSVACHRRKSVPTSLSDLAWTAVSVYARGLRAGSPHRRVAHYLPWCHRPPDSLVRGGRLPRIYLVPGWHGGPLEEEAWATCAKQHGDQCRRRHRNRHYRNRGAHHEVPRGRMDYRVADSCLDLDDVFDPSPLPAG